MDTGNKKTKSNFSQRALTGILFVAILIGAILFNRYSFWLLFGSISFLATREFYNLAEKDSAVPQKISGLILSVILFVLSAAIAVHKLPLLSFAVLLPGIFILFIFELFKKTEKPFLNIGYTILGLVYVALPFSLLNFLAFDSMSTYSFHLPLGIFIILWTSDTGAYLVGKSIGRHPLFTRISPKKTWEGTLGGAALGLVAAYILSFFYAELSVVSWIIVAMIVIVMGGLGDLVESLFKRSIDIKDSGTILPGHGGLLDRFDSLILSIPFIWFYLLFKHAVIIL
jgi:phosphatidate cytidylyltransferase